MSNNKWIPLNGKKEPPFDEQLLIWLSDGDSSYTNWTSATLEEIKKTHGAKVFIFRGGGSDSFRYEHATHYMIPSSPNKVKPPKKV